jgi:hypothetical protein
MTTINPASTATGASSVSNALDKSEIASNFTMFLQLLTTQLRNQIPSIRSIPTSSLSNWCNSRKLNNR